MYKLGIITKAYVRLLSYMNFMLSTHFLKGQSNTEQLVRFCSCIQVQVHF